ncbi:MULTISPECIES: Holliday junction resolvase RuvX [Protofrankia]|uniref:Putative pre-16S rRNA nuclease n=1 Tax=Protofrankia coriariae TaxID=1562887 RepID=A0ABR5F0F9_9ACTN|nr:MULTISPECIES: Holliday junction resolvase RuvX [Protofrankia]KLL10192.1 Holliday junction resolvase [Protofrankia coriariae]ONH34611.1 Holliday junction DNA helicase RuvA [Protofrankia sp. BMG5.30]
MNRRTGVHVGIDVGTVRIGVAASDPDARIAFPVTTLRRDTRLNSDLDEIAMIVRDRHAVEVVVGLPTRLSGLPGPAARKAREYADLLAARVAPVPVRLVDERLTTVVAHRRMAERGLRARDRRAVVDQEAAVQILQSALDIPHDAGASDAVATRREPDRHADDT